MTSLSRGKSRFLRVSSGVSLQAARFDGFLYEAPGDSRQAQLLGPVRVLAGQTLKQYSELRRYVIQVEGYAGVVVHGPLTGTVVVKFSFRAVKPSFDIDPFSVCGRAEGDGKTVKLWAKDAENRLAMEATATLA